MQDITKNDYAQMVKQLSPTTESAKTMAGAFLIGGLICVIGEALTNFYASLGTPEDVASLSASLTLIFFSALLRGLNVYDNIAKVAGAGTLVPITGFANAITAPAMDFKSEGYILGLGAKMFSISGPVIVYGICAGVIYGVIIFLFRLY